MSDVWSRPWTQFGDSQAPEKAHAVAVAVVAQLDDTRERILLSRSLAGEGRATSSDGHGGIAILGDRGSGKSTVLHAVCAELDSRGVDVVLPVVYPELFRETDSVLGTFLATLWERARAASQSTTGELLAEPDGDFELLKLILDAANIYAMARTPARALENSTLGPEYVDEAVAITRSSTRLHQILAAVIRAVSESSGGGLLILPIDDADLSPLGVTGILRDLRMIGSIPGIMPIICASEADLRSSWVREHGAEDTSPQQVSSFRRFLEKVFPYRFRFEIEPLLTRERINFTPIGTDVSVAALTQEFDRLVAERSGGGTPLRPLRAVDPALSLVNSLPFNPRALIQVWDSLESATKLGSGEALSLALRRIMQIVSEPVDDATDAESVTQFARVSPSADSTDLRYRVDFNVDDWALFIAADAYATGRGAAVSQATDSSSHARIQLRRLNSIHSSLTRRASNDTTASDGARRRMTPAVTSAILTVQELIARSNLLECNMETPLFLGHDDFAFLQDVEIAGLKTDNRFLTLPDLATYSSVLSGAQQWNALVDHFREQQPDIETVLTLSLQAALAQTRETQAKLEHAPAYTESFAAVTAVFLDALKTTQERRSEEQRRFIEWYLQGPPLHWHTALLPISTIAAVVTMWSDAIRSWRPEDSRSMPMALLKLRIERILDAAEPAGAGGGDHVWLAGYLSAVAGLIDVTLYERLARIYPAWRQRWTIIRTGAAPSLLSLDVERVGDAAHLSPYPTKNGIELLDSARALLRRLRAAGAQGHMSVGSAG